MKKIILLVSLCFMVIALNAQKDMGIHFLRGTWQAGQSNPAFIPESEITIALPDLYNNFYIENLTYNDLFRNENGEEVLDINNAISMLEANNQLREDLSIKTLGLGIQFGKIYLNLQHAVRFNAFFDYPKTLPQLIWQGNAQFVGQSIPFGPDFELSSYHEIALGAAFQPIKNLSLGGRIKMISGIANISTKKTSLILDTDDDIYQLSLAADYLVNSSGVIDYSAINDVGFNFDFGNLGMKDLFSENTGLAFDLGARAVFGKLDLAASVLDIGKINWKENVKNHSLNGTFEYEGLEIAEGLFEDSVSVEGVLDTLKEIYNFTETNNTFSTKLPTRFYLSAMYHFNNTWSFGAAFYSESYRETAFPAFALGANANLWRALKVGAHYTVRHSTFDNLGLSAALKLGPVQLVIGTDNVLSAVQIKNSNSANFRLGLNILLGEQEKSDPDFY